jgi:hypothetical protein
MKERAEISDDGVDDDLDVRHVLNGSFVLCRANEELKKRFIDVLRSDVIEMNNTRRCMGKDNPGI